MHAKTATLALLVSAAPLSAAANVTSVLPSGPVPEAAIAVPAVAPAPRANWYRSAIPDVAVHLETEHDPEHPGVIISVTARDHTAGHAIERAESAAGPWIEIGAVPRGQAETIDRRIERSQRYYYRVVAMRGTQRSLPSAVVDVDLPAILAALETKAAASNAPRKPLGRRQDPMVYDSDGTALFLFLMAVRAFFGRSRT